MSTRSQYLLAALLAALCLAAFPACNRKPAPPLPPTDGIYRLPLTDGPKTLDPAKFTDVDSEGVARRIFSTLVTLDSQLKPAADVAETWEVSPDGLTYTFHLRKGVLFHNGRELTSADVRYSYERLLRKSTLSHRGWVVEPITGSKALRDGQAEGLSGLETPDPYTVRIRLAEPFEPFLSFLAMGNAAIVPKEEVERQGKDFGLNPVGSGPFTFVRWRENDVIELARNEKYYAGPVALAGLKFRIIKEPTVAYQEYLAGNLEHCTAPEGYLGSIRGDASMAPQLKSVATLSTYYVGITMTHKPAGDNLHLRRAMNYAVDREFICNKVLGGTHVPAKGLLPPGLAAYDPALAGYRYDEARAREELRAAGYGPGGRELPEMTLYYSSRPPNPQVAQAVQSDLRRVGIPVRLQPLELAALLEATNKGEPDLFRLGWVADFPDADNFLAVFHSARFGSAGNRARYANPELDALLAASRREPDAQHRLALLRKAEEMIVADAPWIFLSHAQTNLLVKPYVAGFALSAMDMGPSVNRVDFSRVSFKAAGP